MASKLSACSPIAGKQAFEEVAACWLVLAEEAEWMESKKTSPNEKRKLRS
jgi:hypothetical protein